MSRLQSSLLQSFKKHKDRFFVTFKKDFSYDRYTYGEIFDFALRFITFLKDQGIRPKDRIAICSYNCPQYFYTFLGCILYDVTIVPIEYGSSETLISRFLEQTGSKIIITSKKKIFEARRIDVEILDQTLKNLETSSTWRAKEDSLLEILYTSGTTGEPKGVMLTHKNLHSNITNVLKVLRIKHRYRLLSMLPLSHVFEQVAGFLALAYSGASTNHLKSRRPSEIIKVMQHEKVNVIATVPAFYIMFKKKVEERLKHEGMHKKFLTAQKFTKNLPIPIKRQIFRKIHAVFGNNLKIAICGAATLPAETEMFWESIGIKVLKGYGMTETSPVLTLTREDDRKIDSVGVPIPEVSIRISEDKEILAKGDNITKGYYRNKSETEKLFADGWLKTGDLGEFDPDGHLYIKGRLKNMILKSNGLNVYPEDIEKMLDRCEGIKESCVVGINAGHDVITTAALLLEKEFSEAEIKKIIDSVNAKLEFHQKIQDFYIWKRKDFPRTLTLKVIRRQVVEEIEVRSAHSESKDPLIHILSELSHVDSSKIYEKSRLFFDLGFDSIKVIELSTYIEEKLRVEIDEYKINNDTTVLDLRRLIEIGVDHRNRLKLDDKMFWPVFIPFRILFSEFIYSIARWYFKRVQVIGKDHLQDFQGQFIVIINHSSHLDFPTLAKHFPLRLKTKLAMGAAADYFFKKNSVKDRLVSKFFYYFLAAFPLSRQKDNESTTSIKQSFEFMGEVIDKGWSIGLSPEGTRSKDGKLGTFKSGIGIIVKETRLPVIPVKLEGLHDILPPSSRWPKKRGDVTIKFGKPIYFDESASVFDITKDLEDTIWRM